jgi:hypothetical protein
MSFLTDIEAFVEKAILKASSSVSNVAEDLMTAVVVNTPSPSNPGPFASGLLANQWYPSLGEDFSGMVSSDANVNGSSSLSRIKVALSSQPFLRQDGVVTLTNNVSYAYRAEHLGWPAGEGDNGWHWSGRQGPYAMVSKSMAYVQGKYKV